MVLVTFAETKVARLPGRPPATCTQSNHSQWRRVAFSTVECLLCLGIDLLYISTRNEVYRKLGINYIVTHMNLHDCWRRDYRMQTHRVPQFNMYAIVLSLD